MVHFIDEAKIYIKAGNGGNGCIAFRREKFIENGGPNGGDGGKGGDIVCIATSHLNTLIDFRYKQHFKAPNGEGGKGSNMYGKSGEDLIIHVPVGTEITDETGEFVLHDMDEDQKRIVLIRGGDGGLGNSHFKTSTNQAPRKATKGFEGKEQWIWLKLKLLSDVGLIGLPNAGKSSFLSVSTTAKPKIANYPFTTLKPQLGVVYIDDDEMVLADLPGLIEGASDGLGLGDKFLKHVERCKTLLHLVDITSNDVVADYHLIRNELITYNQQLLNKKEIVVLTKSDLVDSEMADFIAKNLSDAIAKPVLVCSSANKSNIQQVLRACLKAMLD